ncbi:MAG: hypothetical protein H0X37_11035 [Herpetosiphonaceae bacterium]|nr:hypothetical protein [Herpetosiphonaceae bacterium]
MLQVQELRIRYRRLSVNDLFALVLAQSLGALLLTGDEHLRKAATQEQINTHGTLWLLDEIVRLEIISTLQAVDALQRMLDGRRRLPLAASEMRLRVWRR